MKAMRGGTHSLPNRLWISASRKVSIIAWAARITSPSRLSPGGIDDSVTSTAFSKTLCIRRAKVDSSVSGSTAGKSGLIASSAR